MHLGLKNTPGLIFEVPGSQNPAKKLILRVSRTARDPPFQAIESHGNTCIALKHELVEGQSELLESPNELSEGPNELSEGSNELSKGPNKLSDGRNSREGQGSYCPGTTKRRMRRFFFNFSTLFS